jgi:hypothetical protein
VLPPIDWKRATFIGLVKIDFLLDPLLPPPPLPLPAVAARGRKRR